MSINSLRNFAIAAAACVAAAACNSDHATSGNTHTVSLSFTSRAPAAAPSRAGGPGFAIGSGALVITRAQVVLAHVEVTKADTTVCGGDGAGEGSDECAEMHAPPALVDLPVDTGVSTAIVSSVPAGTYTSFEARVKPVSSSDSTGAAFLLAHPGFDSVSVRVEGTYNGNPFVYLGRVRAKLEMEFSPALVVDAAGMNITVSVDLGQWFSDGSGGIIDPSTANAGGPNEWLVAHNIHESFEAFEDDNRDGHADH